MAQYCPYCMRPNSGKYCAYCGGEIDFRGKETHLPVGTHLMGSQAPYLLGAAIGQGGFGVTYAALDCSRGERVAIKEYFPTYWSYRSGDRRNVQPEEASARLYERGRDKFLDEALTIQRLKHLRSIVNVRDYFQANNTAYIVMDYLEGETLAQLVKRKGRLSMDSLWSVLRPLMEDIHDMHYTKVIHRDIAPDNVMVMKDGSWRLLDFGNARSFQKTSSGMTRFVKPGFSPVEQYLKEGSQGSFTDVYSMAATIYYCLSGATPAQSTDRLSEITNGHADPLKSLRELGIMVPDSVEAALRRALTIKSEARTQSMREFCDQLYRDAGTGIRLAFLPFHVVPGDRVLEVGWEGKRQAGTSYALFRRINDGKYRIIGKGNQTSQKDRVPNAAKSVQYRLELQDAHGRAVGSCESRQMDLEGWTPAPFWRNGLSFLRGLHFPHGLLLPTLAALAAVLLAALIAVLVSFF